MFGHQDENGNGDDQATIVKAHDNGDNGAPAVHDDQSSDNPVAHDSPDPTSAPAVHSDQDQPHDHDGDDSAVNSLKDALSPAGGFPVATTQKVKAGSEGGGDTPDDILDMTNNDLASIKIQALDELYPLIDKLDLTPDERFKTLMMMIQASDNQELIKAAYEAAHKIHDEKAKAQALLDIINEINYFTQHPAD